MELKTKLGVKGFRRRGANKLGVLFVLYSWHKQLSFKVSNCSKTLQQVGQHAIHSSKPTPENKNHTITQRPIWLTSLFLSPNKSICLFNTNFTMENDFLCYVQNDKVLGFWC